MGVDKGNSVITPAELDDVVTVGVVGTGVGNVGTVVDNVGAVVGSVEAAVGEVARGLLLREANGPLPVAATPRRLPPSTTATATAMTSPLPIAVFNSLVTM